MKTKTDGEKEVLRIAGNLSNEEGRLFTNAARTFLDKAPNASISQVQDFYKVTWKGAVAVANRDKRMLGDDY